MKHTEQQNEADRQTAINQCSLMHYIDSDNLVKCEEVYDFDNKIWMFFEHMEGGELTKILKDPLM